MFLVLINNGKNESEFLNMQQALEMFELYKENNKHVMLFDKQHNFVKEFIPN